MLLPHVTAITTLPAADITTETTNYLQISHYHIHDHYHNICVFGFDLSETIFAFVVAFVTDIYGRESRLGWIIVCGNLCQCKFVFLSSAAIVTGCWICVY